MGRKVRGLQGSLTDDPFLVFHQLGLHYSGKLLQSLHCLKRQESQSSEEEGSPAPGCRLCSKDHSPVHHCDLTLGGQPRRDSNHSQVLSAWKEMEEWVTG